MQNDLTPWEVQAPECIAEASYFPEPADHKKHGGVHVLKPVHPSIVLAACPVIDDALGYAGTGFASAEVYC